MSDSLRPHGLQHTRPPSPSPTPRVYPNSCPFSRWCHPAVSSSVVPFSSCLDTFKASGSFPRSLFFAWGGQSTGVSASTSVLPMNIQDWFWSWNSNSLATSCKEQTPWKRPWYWERLKAGGEVNWTELKWNTIYPKTFWNELMTIFYFSLSVRSSHSLSDVWLFAAPWTAACQASLSITNSRSLLKLMPIESAMPSNYLILCCPLLFLPSVSYLKNPIFSY